MIIADLHIHSKYSRATSRDCDAGHLDLWARYKGIGLVGTGDFTHPAWRKELAETLVPAEDGLYTLRQEFRIPAEVMLPSQHSIHPSTVCSAPRFLISGEISTIYKKNGKTRKVHHLILLPSLEDAERLSHKLEAIGNLHSDGRPILGLDSRDLLEITLDTCPQAVYIPAHIWTPHFSLFGAFSGFDTLEECYGDMTPFVRAAETGLSSDPPMNRRVSMLDSITLVSNSDAHSPGKLGREANLLDVPYSYPHISRAIQNGEGFLGTLEFYPEEGKYHLDGHRACSQRLEPEETMRLGGNCPVCGKKVTIGVLHRVEELADRSPDISVPAAQFFESLIPLPEVIAASTAASVASKRTQAAYFNMLRTLGTEFSILRELPIETIETAAGRAIGEGIRRLRSGKVHLLGGYDGEYGVISLFAPDELERMGGQLSLLEAQGVQRRSRKEASIKPKVDGPSDPAGQQGGSESHVSAPPATFNEEQEQSITSPGAVTAVVAGPGTGKTRTMVERIIWLIERQGVPADTITAVTFTNQAAEEIRKRIQARFGGKKVMRGLTIGTFHAICLRLLEPKALIGEAEALRTVEEYLENCRLHRKPLDCLRMISSFKNGVSPLLDEQDRLLYEAYCTHLQNLRIRDLDDVMLDALALDISEKKMFTHLLVDEYQDINPIQHRLIRHWSQRSETLFVIGDPDQSIYGFRGADAQCFDRLRAEWPAARFISLRQNYRSTPAILACARSIIDHNPGMPRPLTANRPAGAAVRLMRAKNPFEEAVWIAKSILDMVGGVEMFSVRGVGPERHTLRSFSDIAVLCRTRRQMEQMEECLRHESIPCVVYGRDDTLSNPEVAGALGFFRFLLDPKEETSLENCLRFSYRIPIPLIQRVKVLLAESGDLKLDALREALASWDAIAVLSPWLEHWEAFTAKIKKEKPRKLLQRWVEIHGKNIPMEHLLNASVFHQSMDSFLQTLRLGEEGDLRRCSGPYATDAVRLMTVHGSKGLEFPVVFLCADGFPLSDSAVDIQKTEEERRLFFVGMTRAQDELIVTALDGDPLFVREFKNMAEYGIVVERKTPRKPEQLRLF